MSLSGKYAPTSVSVGTSNTSLLAADQALSVVMLTNTDSANAVWVCSKPQTAVLNKGFYLKAGASLAFYGDDVPKDGLNAIADTAAVTVAVGRG